MESEEDGDSVYSARSPLPSDVEEYVGGRHLTAGDSVERLDEFLDAEDALHEAGESDSGSDTECGTDAEEQSPTLSGTHEVAGGEDALPAVMHLAGPGYDSEEDGGVSLSRVGLSDGEGDDRLPAPAPRKRRQPLRKVSDVDLELPQSSNISASDEDDSLALPSALDEDDVFDVDQHYVEEETAVESLPSPVRARRDERAERAQEHAQEEPQLASKKAPTSFSFALSRASATFYKAFTKPARLMTAVNLAAQNSFANGTNGTRPLPQVKRAEAKGADRDAAAKEKEAAIEKEQAHLRLEHLLKAQIATLNGAKTGFVDLALIRPMTEKCLQAVEHDAMRLLSDYSRVQARVADLKKQTAQFEAQAENELAAKEQILIAAKLSLAEARMEVEALRHERQHLRRQINDPARVAAKAKSELRRKTAQLKLDVRVAEDARIAAEQKLLERKAALKRERAQAVRLEKSYRDLQGDWE